jgi:hypothetical protein
MEIAKIGINKTLKAFQHWASFMVALAIIVIFFSVSLPVASSMAHVIDKNQANMDAVLEKAHAEIAQDQPDPAKLRQAISLLEGYK